MLMEKSSLGMEHAYKFVFIVLMRSNVSQLVNITISSL